MIRRYTTYITYALLLILLFVVSAGCGKDGILKESGPVRSEIRELPVINQIILYDKVNLILTQDPLQQVRIEAGENLLADIETSVSGNTVTIRDNNKYKWVRDLDTKVNVYISAKAFEKIDYYGAGDITSTNELTPEKLTIDSWTGIGSFRLKVKTPQIMLIIRTGNADIILEGSATFCSIYCADQGGIDLRDLVAPSVAINHRSVRDAFINVTTVLEANILYTGNVYYRGSPQNINLTTSSSGRLVKTP